MDVVGIGARIAIGLVLLAAGASKLRARAWGVLALEMGVPRWIVTTLPAFECMLGLGLVLQVLPVVLPWVAVALFAGFTVVVVRQLWSGSEAPCNCFGGQDRRAVTGWTVGRNLVLLALAVLATR